MITLVQVNQVFQHFNDFEFSSLFDMFHISCQKVACFLQDSRSHTYYIKDTSKEKETFTLIISLNNKRQCWLWCNWVNVAAGRLARVVADDQVLQAPCKASVLFPRRGGNIHSFTALTPCAILDVLTPPYAEERGRPSTYYSETPIRSLPRESFNILLDSYRVNLKRKINSLIRAWRLTYSYHEIY